MVDRYGRLWYSAPVSAPDSADQTRCWAGAYAGAFSDLWAPGPTEKPDMTGHIMP
jgi:hypothetical protein